MLLIFVGIVVVIIILCFWQWLLMYQGLNTAKHIELAATNISQEITVRIETRILALTRMAQRWEVRSGTPFEEWKADATNYVNDYAGYHALCWVDKEYCVRWAVPNSDDRAVENLNLLLEEHRNVSQTAQQCQDARVTPTVNFTQGGKGFLICVPLFLTDSQSNSRNIFDGFIVGVFHAQSLINTTFGEKIKQEFAVEVFQENNQIYRSSNIDFENRIENQWSQETEINIRNITWIVRVYPQPAFLKGEYSPLANKVFSSGLITPVLLKWAIYLMQSSHKYAREVETKNRELISEITERKQAEKELRNQNKALESAVVGISELDTFGHYLKVNPAYADLLGYQPEEIIGTHWQQTVHPEDREKANKAYQKMLASEKAEIELRAVRKDGSVFDKILVMVKAYDSFQEFSGHYGFIKDISKRREIERFKDEFISVVSHELRTPLTSIRGSLGLLAAGVLQTKPQQAQRMLEIAVNNSDRLIRLINDILDIERIESKQVLMNKQICDAADLMNSSVEVVRNMAQKAEITLFVNPLSARIWVDCDRIIQVLTNLLSNAIKFSPPGSTVWLTAQIQESPPNIKNLTSFPSPCQGEGCPIEQGEVIKLEDKNQEMQIPHILFQIRDEGRGIPKDKLESIFGRFQQVDASDSRQKGGTGLGLSICRSIIEQHSGLIWAQSTVNQGSTFYFKIPLLQEKESIPQTIKINGSLTNNLTDKNSSENQVDTQQTTKVLIVEDDTDLAQVIISIFERHGIQTYYAKTGREAIHQSLHLLPDLIVLDLVLPEVNGFDIVDSLRHHKRLCKVPLVVYTALDLNDKDYKRLKLGQTLLLTKARVTPEEFERRAINLLEQFVFNDKEDCKSER